MWVQSLGQEDPLEEEMATYSSILAWKIPWTEEAWWVPVHGVTRVRYDLVTKQQKEGMREWQCTEQSPQE